MEAEKCDMVLKALTHFTKGSSFDPRVREDPDSPNALECPLNVASYFKIEDAEITGNNIEAVVFVRLIACMESIKGFIDDELKRARDIRINDILNRHTKGK